MISLQNVTKYFPTKHGPHYVLQDVTLDLPMDKNIGVFGVNGSGKSTLMNLLAGVDQPNKGKITVKGNVSWPLGLSGYQGSMSGRENAEFICRIYGKSKRQIRDKVEFVKEFSELGKFFEMPLKSYSSGMRSKFSFAISMAFDFDYYLIDELTAVGDKRFKDKCNKIFDEKKGKANFLFVSHNMNELKRQCDVGLFIRDGGIHIYDSVDEAISAYNAA
ncbi:ABC transporter ATP-binding protein [Sansalvadorimonas sp. 2012CJ34-2]|uniref:ABC transporter ATP-binding protein n=1 Tax=Parendozoicomonas callyspongiae TaxID=2942213 RepID=A0ABT0PHB1_9GAMM|nr:ABC transporter ATP-binding protein [Sansalvadorimonas sp. 2012CJ34-2]MCL6270765.1 ABC transporter ATP-binding protein [Sansalvadorimonas sp. 2012CJ34-2]